MKNKVQNKAGVELDGDEKTGVHKFFRNSCTCFCGQNAQYKRELGNLLKPLCLNPFWALLPYLLPL